MSLLARSQMVKELCPNIRVSNDARELVLACCTEFIHLLSSEANEMCNNQQKKTINAEHVLMALDSLGYREEEGDRNRTPNYGTTCWRTWHACSWSKRIVVVLTDR